LIDEADTFLKENDELRGILNSGHRRGGQILRTVGEDYEPRQFLTWAPVAIAMIEQLPDTLHD
jgi:putative DNA primase/helicase